MEIAKATEFCNGSDAAFGCWVAGSQPKSTRFTKCSRFWPKVDRPCTRALWADSAYQGLKAWLAATLGWTLTISKHWWTGLHGVWLAPRQQPPEIPRGFHVLKRRWVVERTLAWIGRNRRMSRDFERLIKTSETLLYASMARVMLRRLAKQTHAT